MSHIIHKEVYRDMVDRIAGLLTVECPGTAREIKEWAEWRAKEEDGPEPEDKAVANFYRAVAQLADVASSEV